MADAPHRESSPETAATSESFADLVRHLDVGAYATDDRGHIVAVNPQAEVLLARPASAFLGADSHELLHRRADGAAMPRSECRLLRSLLSRRAGRHDLEWFARGDGNVVPMGWLTAPYRIDAARSGVVVLFFPVSPGGPEGDVAAETADDHFTALGDLTERLALVAETTAVLTSTLDADEALRRLVRLVVPRLADWAVVDLRSGTDELRRAAVVHYEGGVHVSMTDFEGPMPPVSETSRRPLARVLRGGPPLIVDPAEYELPPDSGVAAVQRELFHASGIHSAAVAPLRGPRGVLGALTLGRGDQQRPFDAAELALLDDIARRAGLAVDNAQLYEQQRRVAETMQRHLLPPLPRGDGLLMAARYQPALHGAHVGGDWYDAFLLPDGSTTLVIGDVIGHDLQAAAWMSQVRNMLRALAWDRSEPPGAVVRRLDRALGHVSDAPMATMVLARVEGPEGGPWRLHWSNAGHPPPLLVGHDGQVRFLEEGHGALLGTGLDDERDGAVVPLPPLTTVVLYTDGLVESAGTPLEDGLARLGRHAAALVRRPLEDFCDELLARVRPEGHEDDVALLAMRTPRAGEADPPGAGRPAG